MPHSSVFYCRFVVSTEFFLKYFNTHFYWYFPKLSCYTNYQHFKYLCVSSSRYLMFVFFENTIKQWLHLIFVHHMWPRKKWQKITENNNRKLSFLIIFESINTKLREKSRICFNANNAPNTSLPHLNISPSPSNKKKTHYELH